MFTIHTGPGDFWYPFFYLLSNFLTYLALLFIGWKKGYPMLKWSLILLSGSVLFIIGTKVFTFRYEEWSTLFRDWTFPQTMHRSAIGGLLLAILGIEGSRLLLRMEEYVLDTYAMIVPLGLAIQKPGCILAGCCYGNPTTLPWGIHYDHGSVVHYHHWISDWIAASDVLSLPVHPVPIYEIISYLLIFTIVMMLGPRLTRRGSRFLMVMMLLCAGRFVTEFFRDPTASLVLGRTLLGLKTIQWALLAIMLTVFILLIRKINKSNKYRVFSIQADDKFWTLFILLLILAIFQLGLRDAVSPMEIVVWDIKFMVVLVLFGAFAWRKFTVPGFRLAGLFLLSLPLFIMGQSLPGSEGIKEYYHSVGAGMSRGNYSQELLYNPHTGACGTEYDSKFFDQRYITGALNYHYSTKDGFKSTAFGADLFGGFLDETEQSSGSTRNYHSFGMRPYASYDVRWIGIGGGLSFGSLFYAPDDSKVGSRNVTTGLVKSPIMPSLYARVGPYDMIDFTYRFRDDFPTFIPSISHQFSLGSGLGFDNGSGIRVGISLPAESFFVSANALIDNSLMIHSSYYWAPVRHFSIGVHYRIHRYFK